MNVLVIGANGNTGRQVVERLGKENAHRVRAMIRDEAQAADLERLGAETVVADLEGEIGHAFDNVDAVIFAAGSGSHTGPDKTESVDRLGAMKSIDEAKKHGAGRFIMLSSIGADDPAFSPKKIRHYLVAKGEADEHLMKSGLEYTIIRPGGLTDDPADGSITAEDRIEDRSRSIPRADVANVLVACLDEPNTSGKAIEILSGDTPIEQALRSV